jgi:hypothetical protein
MDKAGTNPVAWAWRVNGRWIVHGGLGEMAGTFLARLEREDPARLAQACSNARHLVRQAAPGEDPKPWFYGGLFSVATPAELAEYLSRHWLLRTVLSEAQAGEAVDTHDGEVSESTWQLIGRLREAVRGLAASCDGKRTASPG